MEINTILNGCDILNEAINDNAKIIEVLEKRKLGSKYISNIRYRIKKYKLNDNNSYEFLKLLDIYYNSKKSDDVNTNILNNELNTDNISVKYNYESNDSLTLNIRYNNHIKTLDDLLKITEVDLNVWKVKDYIVNKWDVTSWKNSKPETVQNFQVKARLERNITEVIETNLAELFINNIKNYNPPTLCEINNNSINIKSNDENNLLEITMFDLHLGKLTWSGETGEDYDIKIASERFNKTLIRILDRCKSISYNKILFPIGNDFFNSDTILNTTTKGTPIDEDNRWQKTFKIGCKLIVDAIYIMKQYSKVQIDVVIIPGNHDFERSYYLGEYLYAWFNNDNDVTINNSASPRKYYKFGDVLLGFTHGSEEKEKSLPLLMASDIESKPLWSDSKYHEWHLGHFHRKKDVKYITTNEDLGVIIRYLSSLSGTDEWHHKSGFIGSLKSGEAFIWNDKLGMIAHYNCNLIL